MSYWTLSKKIPYGISIVTLLTGLIISGVAIYEVRQSTYVAEKEKMLGLLEAQHHSMAVYLSNISKEVDILSANASVLEAIRSFNAAWDLLGQQLKSKVFPQMRFHP